MILTKEVGIRVNSNNAKYYENLGYIIPMKEATKNTKQVMHKNFVYDFSKTIMVKVEDLPKSSFARVDVLCDYCNKEIFSITYHHYNEETKHINKHACKNCWQKKKEEVFMMKYGVKSPLQLECVRKRKIQSYINHYGVDNPNKSPEVRKKTAQTLYINSSQKASKQQRYINNLYHGVLNFPIKYYNADIYLPDNNLIVEYDGSGHMLNVNMGRETMEEYIQKEIVRYNIVKREGYKQMKIISGNDNLPTDTILLQMLSEAKQYFSDYPQHSWIEFNIDTSSFRNAENKQGIPYDYGKLRKIKDSDLNTIQDSDLSPTKETA